MSTPRRTFLGFTAGQAALLITVVPWLMHLAVMARPGLGTDEAHYALYGLELDWSYFDHPPMVGWLQAITLQVSDSEFALRVIPMLMAAATLWALWRLVPRLFPDASPWVAVGALALMQTGPVLMLWGMLLIPEVPLVLIGLLLIHITLDLLDKDSLGRWLLLGLLLGLAGLSKYTAVTLALSVVLMFAWERRWSALRRPGPWLAMLLAAVIVSPVLLWNMHHDWASFRYQIDHGTGGDTWSLSRLGTAEGQQLAYYGPLIFLATFVALGASWREREKRGVRTTYAFTLPILLVFGYSSGFDKGLPHWTALAFIATTPLAARWLAAHWQRTALRRICLGWGGAMLLLSLFVHSELTFPWAPWSDFKNPHAALTGWDEAAHESQRLQAEMAATPGPPPHVFIDNWSRAARLAWYGRPEPVQVLDNKLSQFDLWYGNPEPGDRGILVVWDRDGETITAATLSDAKRFRSVKFIKELNIDINGRRLSRFLFFACDDYLD